VSTCFVIQPFDRGMFDKRYDDVIAPAIRAAGLEPYRVDRDPSASVLIESIEKGIRSAAVCVAEITTDNTNVWYELGYAFAAGKDVVMVSAKDRAKFPFDVQHRNILVYATESTSDFEKLGGALTGRLEACIKKERDSARLVSPMRSTEGLLAHEVTCLAVVMENTLLFPTASISGIKNDMERAGFTATAVGISVRGLQRKGLLAVSIESDRDGGDYQVFSLTKEGEAWLVDHQAELQLTAGPPPPVPVDEIPF
jgi:nucleoside 2-deoxyribosyltransferase